MRTASAGNRPNNLCWLVLLRIVEDGAAVALLVLLIMASEGVEFVPMIVGAAMIILVSFLARLGFTRLFSTVARGHSQAYQTLGLALSVVVPTGGQRVAAGQYLWAPAGYSRYFVDVYLHLLLVVGLGYGVAIRSRNMGQIVYAHPEVGVLRGGTLWTGKWAMACAHGVAGGGAVYGVLTQRAGTAALAVCGTRTLGRGDTGECCEFNGRSSCDSETAGGFRLSPS